MEEFEKIDWTPNIEDIIDIPFFEESRLQNEGAMYKILNGIFEDPFQDIRPVIFKNNGNPTVNQNKTKPAIIVANKGKGKGKKKRTKKKKKN